MPFFLVRVRHAASAVHHDHGEVDYHVLSGIVLIQAPTDAEARAKIIALSRHQSPHNPGAALVAAALEDSEDSRIKEFEIIQYDGPFCLCVEGSFVTMNVIEEE